MKTVQLDLDAMKEVVDEYYPKFFKRTPVWSKWTLENVYNVITDDRSEQTTAFILDVVSYMGNVVVDELNEARVEYVEYMRMLSDNRLAVEEADLFYERYLIPLVNFTGRTETADAKYISRRRINIMNFIKEGKDSPMNAWASATDYVRHTIRRAREIYYNIARPDVDALLQLLSSDVKDKMVRAYCADHNVEDAIKFINGEASGFVPIEPNLDDLIRAASIRVCAIKSADPHDLMGKFIVPIMVGKHGLKPDEMTSVNDQYERFIQAIMRFDSNIMSMFQDQSAKMRDAVVDVLNSYRDAQYRALEELGRVVLLAINDGFSKTVLQYYVPAIHDYVQGRVDYCDVNEPDLRDWLRQARDELAAIKEINARSPAATEETWDSTLTTVQRESIMLMTFASDDVRDLVIKQLHKYDGRAVLAYINGELDMSDATLAKMHDVELKLHMQNARCKLQNIAKREELNTGVSKMGMNIDYHGRLEVANDELKGTITLSIDGELAIVDVSAPYGQQRVDYSWVILPKHGFDTAVHGQLVWLGHDAAVSIIVVVYKDGGTASTVTVTKDICGTVLA